METITGLNDILRKGHLDNELDFERASLIDRQLRLLAKENPDYAIKRKQLRLLLKTYEEHHWVSSVISEEKINESDLAERIVEKERVFIEKRKLAIKDKLKQMSLTQKELAVILGHKSSTYMSELVNGLNPFTMRDLAVIHLLLNIEWDDLIPTILTMDDRTRILSSIAKLKNPKIKIDRKDLALI